MSQRTEYRGRERAKSVCELTSQCIAALGRLYVLPADGRASAEVEPEELHDGFQKMIESLRREARRCGYSRAEIDDMSYPIVALADELAVKKSDAVRDYWSASPLQVLYFNEDIGGENFFPRIDALRSERGANPELLKVYYTCLLLGFGGKYAVMRDEAELRRTVAELRDDLEQAGLIRLDESLAARGGRPGEGVLLQRGARGQWPILGIVVLSALMCAAAYYAGARLLHGAHVEQVKSELAATGSRAKHI